MQTIDNMRLGSSCFKHILLMDGFCCGVVEVNSGVFEILKELTLIYFVALGWHLLVLS